MCFYLYFCHKITTNRWYFGITIPIHFPWCKKEKKTSTFSEDYTVTREISPQSINIWDTGRALTLNFLQLSQPPPLLYERLSVGILTCQRSLSLLQCPGGWKVNRAGTALHLYIRPYRKNKQNKQYSYLIGGHKDSKKLLQSVKTIKFYRKQTLERRGKR